MEEQIRGILSELGFSDDRVEQLRLAKKSHSGPFSHAPFYRPEEPPSYSYGFKKRNSDTIASDSTDLLEKRDVKSKEYVTRNQLFSKLDILEHTLVSHHIGSNKIEQQVINELLVRSLQLPGTDKVKGKQIHSSNSQSDQLSNESLLLSNNKVINWLQSNLGKTAKKDMSNKVRRQGLKDQPIHLSKGPEPLKPPWQSACDLRQDELLQCSQKYRGSRQWRKEWKAASSATPVKKKAYRLPEAPGGNKFSHYCTREEILRWRDHIFKDSREEEVELRCSEQELWKELLVVPCVEPGRVVQAGEGSIATEAYDDLASTADTGTDSSTVGPGNRYFTADTQLLRERERDELAWHSPRGATVERQPEPPTAAVLDEMFREAQAALDARVAQEERRKADGMLTLEEIIQLEYQAMAREESSNSETEWSDESGDLNSEYGSDESGDYSDTNDDWGALRSTAPTAPIATLPTMSQLTTGWLDQWRQSGTPKEADMAEACRQAAAAQVLVEAGREKWRELSAQTKSKESAGYARQTPLAPPVTPQSAKQAAGQHSQPPIDDTVSKSSRYAANAVHNSQVIARPHAQLLEKEPATVREGKEPIGQAVTESQSDSIARKIAIGAKEAKDDAFRLAWKVNQLATQPMATGTDWARNLKLTQLTLIWGPIPDSAHCEGAEAMDWQPTSVYAREVRVAQRELARSQRAELEARVADFKKETRELEAASMVQESLVMAARCDKAREAMRAHREQKELDSRCQRTKGHKAGLKQSCTYGAEGSRHRLVSFVVSPVFVTVYATASVVSSAYDVFGFGFLRVLVASAFRLMRACGQPPTVGVG